MSVKLLRTALSKTSRFALVLGIFGVLQAHAGNFASCIIEKMPKVQNESAVMAIVAACRQKYPGAYCAVQKGSGLGFFSKYDSWSECAEDLATKTTSSEAGRHILLACRCLYEVAIPHDELCVPASACINR